MGCHNRARHARYDWLRVTQLAGLGRSARLPQGCRVALGNDLVHRRRRANLQRIPQLICRRRHKSENEKRRWLVNTLTC